MCGLVLTYIIYTYEYMHLCAQACLCKHECVLHVYVHVCVYICVHMLMNMTACVWVPVCLYVHEQKHKASRCNIPSCQIPYSCWRSTGCWKQYVRHTCVVVSWGWDMFRRLSSGYAFMYLLNYFFYWHTMLAPFKIRVLNKVLINFISLWV